LKHPFDADSLVTLASKILRDQFPPPDENMYSKDLVGLIKMMLRKDAALRPMVDAILSSPFLQAKMHETNNNYGLGLDLTEFATAFVAPIAPMSPVVEEPAAADDRRQEVEVAAVASPAPPLVAAAAALPAGAGDTVLIGTMPPQPPAEPPAEKNDGGDASEYEEEFEDYSGSEDGDKPEQNALQQSVAKLRLGPGPESAAPVSASSGQAGGMVAAGESSSGTRIGGKAESLRNYLCAQLTKEIFDVAYALVRGASGEGVPAETLQLQVGEVIGADKAPELFTLFQLLCFLEDVALNDPAPAP